MSEMEWTKVQGHGCPDCGAAVLRGTLIRSEGDQLVRTTARYLCSAHCGWEISGPSLPV